MSAVTQRMAAVVLHESTGTDRLFQVWIELNDGYPHSDWWWNSEPQSLATALDEAAQCRAGGWTCQVTPEGFNPRPDGRWDNP